MSTTLEISGWYDHGVRMGATHLLIVSDHFDREDFPQYVMPGENVIAAIARFDNRRGMLRLIEVYNLSLDKRSQLNEYRAYNL